MLGSHGVAREGSLTDPTDKLLTELEEFGKVNDSSTTDRTRRMLNITRDTGEFLAVLVRAIDARDLSTVARHVSFERVRVSLTEQLVTAYTRKSLLAVSSPAANRFIKVKLRAGSGTRSRSSTR